MSMDFSDVTRMAADLRGAATRVGPMAQIAVRKTAKDIQADARKRAPRDHLRPPKDPSRPVTGNLRNSITTSDLRTTGRSGNVSAEVGPTAEYGLFQELGTATMPARPFLGPAADKHLPAFEQAMVQLGAEAVND